MLVGTLLVAYSATWTGPRAAVVISVPRNAEHEGVAEVAIFLAREDLRTENVPTPAGYLRRARVEVLLTPDGVAEPVLAVRARRVALSPTKIYCEPKP